MKIVRSTKCSTKFTTQAKREVLDEVLHEYGKVVNIFIDHFWENGTVAKAGLLKSIVDIPKNRTWLSARLRKVAAREAIDMVRSVQEVFEHNQEQLLGSVRDIEAAISNTEPDTRKNRRRIDRLYRKRKSKLMKIEHRQPTKPKHKGNRMCVSCTIAELQAPKETTEFNSWLHIASVGHKISLDIPIKFHKHYHNLATTGTRQNAYIITRDYVQFSFEIDTGPKKDVHHCIGVDSGIKALASTSDGEQFGRDIEECIERVKRCKNGSKGKKRAVAALHQKVDEVAKAVVQLADLIVVEKLQKMNIGSKVKRRLTKNMRRSIGSWNYRYWLERLEQQCERYRVSFRTVPAYYTSQRCPVCGHTDRGNRSGELFLCLECGFSGNADIVGALNILERFSTGKYGSCCKRLTTNFL
jgi:IS605 OrfB family transposase